MIKMIAFASLLTLGFKPCNQDIVAPMVEPVPMHVRSNQMPRTATVSTPVTIRITASGANLCYSLDQLVTQQVTPNRTQVHALWLPKVDPHTLICAQAIYTKDSTVVLRFPSTGQHLVEFMKGNQVLQTDTVLVN